MHSAQKEGESLFYYENKAAKLITQKGNPNNTEV